MQTLWEAKGQGNLLMHEEIELELLLWCLVWNNCPCWHVSFRARAWPSVPRDGCDGDLSLHPHAGFQPWRLLPNKFEGKWKGEWSTRRTLPASLPIPAVSALLIIFHKALGSAQALFLTEKVGDGHN